MGKKIKFIPVLLSTLLLASLFSACSQSSPTPSHTLAPSPTVNSVPVVATATSTSKALPDPWYPFPERGYKNPTLAGPNGDLVKTLAENSTRYSAAQIAVNYKAKTEITMTVLAPGNGVVWFEFHIVMQPTGAQGEPRQSSDYISLDGRCYAKEGAGSWQIDSQEKCLGVQSLVLEMHPLLSILLGPPDSPIPDPATAERSDIVVWPDEVLDGKQVGFLSLFSTTQPNLRMTKIWYDKSSLRILKSTDSINGEEMVITFSHYDDPALKITAPSPGSLDTSSIAAIISGPDRQ